MIEMNGYVIGQSRRCHQSIIWKICPSRGVVNAFRAPSLSQAFEDTSYFRPLRRYQLLAVEAFERRRHDGASRAYLVLPPGAGKTVLGLEIARRLGRQTLA